jgi:hypothetical protein
MWCWENTSCFFKVIINYEKFHNDVVFPFLWQYFRHLKLLKQIQWDIKEESKKFLISGSRYVTEKYLVQLLVSNIFRAESVSFHLLWSLEHKI